MSFLNTLIPTLSESPEVARATQFRTPRYEVNETQGSYDVTVYLPGVAKEGLEVTDEAGELTIIGKRAAGPEGRTLLHREALDADFKLVVTHDETVDSEKIAAELRDGVLQLKLAKAESAKPRKVLVA